MDNAASAAGIRVIPNTIAVGDIGRARNINGRALFDNAENRAVRRQADIGRRVDHRSGSCTVRRRSQGWGWSWSWDWTDLFIIEIFVLLVFVGLILFRILREIAVIGFLFGRFIRFIIGI